MSQSLVRIIRCEHSDVLPGTIGVVEGPHAGGLAVTVTVHHPDRTITVYVEHTDIEPVSHQEGLNGHTVDM